LKTLFLLQFALFASIDGFSTNALSFQDQCVETPAQEAARFVHLLEQARQLEPTPGTDAFVSPQIDALEAQEAQQLWIEASSIYQKFFNGEASLEKSNRQIDQIASRFDSAPEQKILFLGLARNVLEVLAQSYTHDLILDHVSGAAITEIDLSKLRSLGVDDPELYIELMAAKYRTHFEQLKAKGVIFDSQLGWDFSDFELHVKDLQEGSSFLKAFKTLVTSDGGLIERLRNPNRTEAIALGNHTILPPRKHNATGEIFIPWQKTSFYEQQIRGQLKRIETLQGEFEQAVQDVTSYSNLMRGRAWELVGGERGDKGRTDAEIRLERIKSDLRFQTAQLKNHLGVSRELLAQVYEIDRALNDFERNEIDKGIARLKTATAVAIAAPIIPIAMYALPAAGAGLVALPGAKALAAPLALSAKMFAAGSAFTAAEVTGRALIYTAHGQGSVMDKLLDEAQTTGVQGLKMSAMFATIPLALPAVSGVAAVGTIAATSRSLRAVGFSATAARAQALQRGAAAFGATERIGSQAMSAGFGIFGATTAVNGAMDCAKLIDSIHEAAARGEEEKAINQISAEAWSTCLSNAVDVGEALVAGGIVGKRGLDLARQRTAESKRLGELKKLEDEGTRARALTLFPKASEAQLDAILSAHYVGKDQPGADGNPAGIWADSDGNLKSNWTKAQLKEKVRILREADIPLDVRVALMENGVTGLPLVRPKPSGLRAMVNKVMSALGLKVQQKHVNRRSKDQDELYQYRKENFNKQIGAETMKKIEALYASFYKDQQAHQGLQGFPLPEEIYLDYYHIKALDLLSKEIEVTADSSHSTEIVTRFQKFLEMTRTAIAKSITTGTERSPAFVQSLKASLVEGGFSKSFVEKVVTKDRIDGLYPLKEPVRYRVDSGDNREVFVIDDGPSERSEFFLDHYERAYRDWEAVDKPRRFYEQLQKDIGRPFEAHYTQAQIYGEPDHPLLKGYLLGTDPSNHAVLFAPFGSKPVWLETGPWGGPYKLNPYSSKDFIPDVSKLLSLIGRPVEIKSSRSGQTYNVTLEQLSKIELNKEGRPIFEFYINTEAGKSRGLFSFIPHLHTISEP
jgi:hypothetical protein